MHNYKNNRNIIRAQVQPGPCDDKYNALCTNTNTCNTITNTSMTMCFCVSGPFSPMRLAWVGRCGDTGWIQMSSSWEEALDDLWSTWQQKFNLLDLARANQIFRRIHGVMVVMWTSFYAKWWYSAFRKMGLHLQPIITSQGQSQAFSQAVLCILESCSTAKFLGILAYSP